MAFRLRGPGPPEPPSWIRLWFWDKIAPLSSCIKKHLKQNLNDFCLKTWRTRIKSLDSFLKPPEIAWHYYDVDTWSPLLSLTFVRVNPKLKKLQFRTKKTYWLCSHYWNDRRSRRVFHRFYSAIFQLMSAKFQTLLITRERLGLATWNFDSSLRLLSYMFVPNFEAIGHVTLVLEPENRPASLA